MRSISFVVLSALTAFMFMSEADAQSTPTRSHPEVVGAMTCTDLTRDLFLSGRMFGNGRSPFGLTIREWTKQDLRGIRAKFDDCEGRAGHSPAARAVVDGVLEDVLRTAPDPEGDAQKKADEQRVIAQRQRDYVVEQEKSRLAAAAETAEHERHAAEQRQRLAMEEAQARQAEAEAALRGLQDQQAALDQQARDTARQASEQAAADQASTERIERARQQQLASNQAAEEVARQLPTPLVVACSSPDILGKVRDILAKRPNMEVFKIYNSETNPAFSAYLASSAIDRVRLARQIFSVPQCYAMAITSIGELPIAFRQFVADHDTYIEVTDRAN